MSVKVKTLSKPLKPISIPSYLYKYNQPLHALKKYQKISRILQKVSDLRKS